MGLLFHNEHDALKAHLAQWATWSTSLQQRFEIVVVDDCSNLPSASSVLSRSFTPSSPNVRVLRLLPPKRPWNIGGARNLLMHLSSSCWVVMCDIDYSLSAPLAQIVFDASRSASKEYVFKFHRNRALGPVHPAIALVRKDLYWEAGGCDEDFVGHYVWTDPHFWYRLQLHEPKPTIIANSSWPSLLTMTEAESCRNTDPRGQPCRVEDTTSVAGHEPSAVKDNKFNGRLFNRKKRGDVPWSNSYLRFSWVDEFVDGTNNSYKSSAMPRHGSAPSCSRVAACDTTLSETRFARFIHRSTLATARNASRSCSTVLYTTQLSIATPLGSESTLAAELMRRAPPHSDAQCQFALLSPDTVALLARTKLPWTMIELRLSKLATGLSARSASKIPKLQPYSLFPGAEHVIFVDFKLALRVELSQLASFALNANSCISPGDQPYFAAYQHPCVSGPAMLRSIPAWCGAGNYRTSYRRWTASSWMRREATIVSRKQKVNDVTRLHSQTARYARLIPSSSDVYVDTALLVWRKSPEAKCLSNSWTEEFLRPENTDRDQPPLALIMHDMMRCGNRSRACLLPPLPPACSTQCSWYCRDCFKEHAPTSTNAVAAEIFVDASIWGAHGGQSQSVMGSTAV